jgi:hypothetical protein
MRPTLPEAAALLVEPYEGKRIRRGDVVVFNLPGSSEAVVHRVAVSHEDRLFTKGDANVAVDISPVSPGDVVGQVRYASAGASWIRIHGGWRGVCAAKIAKACRSLTRLGFGALSKSLLPIAHWRIIRSVWSLAYKPKAVYFRRGGESTFLLLVGRRVVGRFVWEQDRWMIRRPFSFFIDERVLPKPEIRTDSFSQP